MYKPSYTITNDILTYVSFAEAAKSMIENAALVPSWERSFRNQALVRTVHHSTAIEGNALDINQAKRLVAGESIESVRLRDVKEISNYRDVVGFISGIEDKYVTIGLLLDIHKRLGSKILPDEYLGVFRDKKVVIVNSTSGEVVFDAPDPDEIKYEIDELIKWDEGSNGIIHPLIKAGILHYELVRIHPYIDLNGRTARILATWSLYRDGYDIRKFFSLEEYYDQNPKLYYESLDSAHEGDLTNWLSYFTRGVAEEFERIKTKVLGLSRDRKLRSKLGQVALNERQVSIITFFEQKDELKNPDFVELFPNISDDTILRDLKDLIDKGIIKKLGRTKGAKYILTS